MGGSPFGDPTAQGFLTGLYTDPRPQNEASTDDLECLEVYKTWLKLSMAGNLRDYVITLPDGTRKKGSSIKYGHHPAAYCKHPQENVLYLGCHDNESMYDLTVLKVNHCGHAPVCARTVQMALALIAVSQGIAFFHAGDDLLRSKSLDRDSYNSGDWFNKLVWDGSGNNFGVCQLVLLAPG
jgi:pullulanase